MAKADYTAKEIDEAYSALDAIGYERLPQRQKDLLEWLQNQPDSWNNAFKGTIFDNS